MTCLLYNYLQLCFQLCTDLPQVLHMNHTVWHKLSPIRHTRILLSLWSEWRWACPQLLAINHLSQPPPIPQTSRSESWRCLDVALHTPGLCSLGWPVIKVSMHLSSHFKWFFSHFIWAGTSVDFFLPLFCCLWPISLSYKKEKKNMRVRLYGRCI